MSDDTYNSDGIECPYCGYVHMELEIWENLVTYWGDDGTRHDCECESCEKTFEVSEDVTRSWESFKSEERT